jgi:hypothetical protein
MRKSKFTDSQIMYAVKRVELDFSRPDMQIDNAMVESVNVRLGQ